MALLDATRLRNCRQDIAQSVMERKEIFNVFKADLAAAVAAVDQWVESNAISFNTAIPQPARGLLTAKQKAELLMSVVRQRFEVT